MRKEQSFKQTVGGQRNSHMQKKKWDTSHHIERQAQNGSKT